MLSALEISLLLPFFFVHGFVVIGWRRTNQLHNQAGFYHQSKPSWVAQLSADTNLMINPVTLMRKFQVIKVIITGYC